MSFIFHIQMSYCYLTYGNAFFVTNEVSICIYTRVCILHIRIIFRCKNKIFQPVSLFSKPYSQSATNI